MAVLNTSQAADYIGISDGRVRQLCQQGRLGVKLGKFWIIPKDQAKAFRAAQRPTGKHLKKTSD